MLPRLLAQLQTEKDQLFPLTSEPVISELRCIAGFTENAEPETSKLLSHGWGLTVDDLTTSLPALGLTEDTQNSKVRSSGLGQRINNRVSPPSK